MRRIGEVTILLLLMIFYMPGCRPDAENVSDTEPVVKVHFIDVGQGDSILITSPGGNVLIDSGEYVYYDKVSSYLDKAGVKKIDYIVATHPHSDHMGCMAKIIDSYGEPAVNVIFPEVTNNTAAFTYFLKAVEDNDLNVIKPVAGSGFQLGDLQFTIVAPNSSNYIDMNNYSVVIRMVYGKTAFLFTGDQETVSEDEVLDKGFDISADILKIGHHGSSSSTSEYFLDQVNPAVAVISCGINNDFGHPHKQVLKRLDDRGIRILRTDTEGDIVIKTDGNKITYDGGTKQ